MTPALAIGACFLALATETPTPAPPPTPQAEPDGPTVRLVYIGSSYCGFCKRPELQKALADAREAASAWAKTHEYAFVTTGVSTDLDVDRGWQFLSESGRFDEVIIGRGWLNQGAVAWVAPFPDDPLALFGEPQLVVLVEDRRLGRNKIQTVVPPRPVFRSLGSLIPRHATPESIRAALDGVLGK